MRKLGQALVLLVMAICAAGAAGFVVLAVQYNRFSADIHRSEAPLPATIRAVLPPSKGTLDQPQVTLVRGSGDLASGGLVLFRTVPDDGTAAFLSVPPSTIVNGVRVSRQSTPELIGVPAGSSGGSGLARGRHQPGERLAPRRRDRRDPASQPVGGRAAGLAVADMAVPRRDASPNGPQPPSICARERPAASSATRPSAGFCGRSSGTRSSPRASVTSRRRHRRRPLGRHRSDRCGRARAGVGSASEPPRRAVHAPGEHPGGVRREPGIVAGFLAPDSSAGVAGAAAPPSRRRRTCRRRRWS